MMKEVTFEDGPMGMGLDPIEEGQDGAIVKMVSEGSQAEKIGVQEGDLVKFIAGENVTETNIESMMKMQKPRNSRLQKDHSTYLAIVPGRLWHHVCHACLLALGHRRA